MEVSGQLHAPAALPPGGGSPGTHWIGGWVSPRAVLDAVVKRKIPSPRRESNPRTPIVQKVSNKNFGNVSSLGKLTKLVLGDRGSIPARC
jgi:hypothetical protein